MARKRRAGLAILPTAVRGKAGKISMRTGTAARSGTVRTAGACSSLNVACAPGLSVTKASGNSPACRAGGRASANDEFLGAAAQREIALLIQPTQVSGVQPPLSQPEAAVIRLPQVTREDVRTLDAVAPDLTPAHP